MSIERQLSTIDSIQKIDQLQAAIDSYRPIPEDIQGRIFQKFRLEWNYHSNAIEGNPYTFGETVTFILHGITAKGKKLKDHLDIKGHNDGINFLLGLVKDQRDINETDIRNLHKIILVQEYEVDAITPTGQFTKKVIQLGQYKTSPNHVKTATGEMHYYASPEETPALMTDLINWYSAAKKDAEVHPLILATLFHHKFVAIHPFDDGNGRLGRILMNLILMRFGFPPIVVRQEDQNNYCSVLSQADTGDYFPIIEYMSNLLLESLNIQFDGVRGMDISEPSDVDKEIALFKANLEQKRKLPKSRTKETLEYILTASLTDLLSSLQKRYQAFNDLFDEHQEELAIEFAGQANSTLNPLPIFNEHWAKTITANRDLMHSLKYKYAWNGFKQAATPFGLTHFIQIQFDTNHYSIRFHHAHGDTSLKKAYPDLVNDIEANQIVEQIVKSIISSIQKKIEDKE